MALTIIEQLNNWTESINDWIITISKNDYFWVVMFFAILIIILIAFNTFHKNK
ncbi:MAG: hypothetical protein ACK5HP_02315 [Bacilli bacterium]